MLKSKWKSWMIILFHLHSPVSCMTSFGVIDFCFFISWIPEDDLFQKEKKGKLPFHFLLCPLPGTNWDQLQDQISARICVLVIENWKSSVDVYWTMSCLCGTKGIWLLYFIISLIMLSITLFVGHYKIILLNSGGDTWHYSPF